MDICYKNKNESNLKNIKKQPIIPINIDLLHFFMNLQSSNRSIGPAVIVRQWPGRPGFNPRSSHTKDSKMVLDASLLNTQHYTIWIKGTLEQSRESSSALPLHLGVVAIKKEAFGSPT